MSQHSPSTILARILSSRDHHDLFHDLCRCGGRLTQSPGELAARGLLENWLTARGFAVARVPFRFPGWRLQHHALALEAPGETLPAWPLVGSASGDLTLPVVDVGRGTAADFERVGAVLPGALALVRHEYMFAPDTIHRRHKVAEARARGAAALAVAGPLPGQVPLAGAIGGGEGTLPGVAVALEGGRRLAQAARAGEKVHLTIAAETPPFEAYNLVVDIGGQGPERVVLSAHLDGHAFGESAMDNASGVAAALGAFAALAPEVAHWRRGVRLCLFTAEEWGLTGSARYLETLGAAERQHLVLNVNLDSVAGSPHLTVLTSGFAQLGPFLRGACEPMGIPLGVYEPPMANSDHINFARHGIPAARLVAGFDRLDSDLRFVLTAADTRDKVPLGELTQAALAAAAMVVQGATAAALPAA